MRIISHRGNIHGPDPLRDNEFTALRECAKRGWGVEIDVRWDDRLDGGFYLSHDKAGRNASNALEHNIFALSALGALLAINIKEPGREALLSAEIGTVPCFVFDMELAGADHALFTVPKAVRISDREPKPAFEADIVWLDEFGPWVTSRDVAELKAAGKTIYAVSPELHHPGLGVDWLRRKRWEQFAAWGVDGICTDYPCELEGVL